MKSASSTNRNRCFSRLWIGLLLGLLLGTAAWTGVWAEGGPTPPTEPVLAESAQQLVQQRMEPFEASKTSEEPREPSVQPQLLAQLDPDAALRTMGLRNRLTGVAKAAAYRPMPGDQRAHDLMRNLLLLLTYEQDPTLRKLLRRKDYVNAMVFGASLGVFGVNLSQHLYAFHLAYHKPIPDGFHDIKLRAQTLVNLALIEDGIELAAAAVVGGWSAYYSHKVNQRKKLINAKVDALLEDLEHGANDTYAKLNLLDLLKNEESAVEFLNIWRAAHAGPAPEQLPLAEQDLFGRRVKRVQF